MREPEVPEPVEIDPAVLLVLAENFGRMATGVGELNGLIRTDLRPQIRSTRRTQPYMIAGVVVAILVSLLGYLGVRATQDAAEQARAAARSAQDTSAVVLDCTTPEGGCWKRGREATAEAVGRLVSEAQANVEEIVTRVGCLLHSGTDCPPPPG